jgi:hypothetical protein
MASFSFLRATLPNYNPYDNGSTRPNIYTNTQKSLKLFTLLDINYTCYKTIYRLPGRDSLLCRKLLEEELDKSLLEMLLLLLLADFDKLLLELLLALLEEFDN